MNDGVIFFIGVWLLVILTATQWLDILWQGKNERRTTQTRRGVLLFLLLIVMCQGIYLPVTPFYYVNAGVFLLIALAFFISFWLKGQEFRLQILAVCLFLGIFYAVAYELLYLDPILMIIPPLYLLPAFLTLFVALTTTDLKYQWIMLTGGLLFGEILHHLFLLKHVPIAYAGDAAFRDQMILTFVFAGTLHLLIKGLYRCYLILAKFRQPQGEQEG